MKTNGISAALRDNLAKIVGGQIAAIYLEAGRSVLGDHLAVNGSGMVVIEVNRGATHYKWRLKFHAEVATEFYGEFYEWQGQVPIRERYDPKTSALNYDRATGEDPRQYPWYVDLAPRKEEDPQDTLTIQSIRLYHYVAAFAEAGQAPEREDYLALIEITTATGRQILIEEDDPRHTFWMYFDDPDRLAARLAEVHDDPGPTLGQRRYQLRHEFR
ncbi:MAG: hypothetical protein AAFR05_13815 [Bacteroidota bacterium]